MIVSEEELKYPVVCFGEILWDLLPHGKMPGGAPVNVAYHLKMLGKNPAVISRVGNDELGKELIKLFEKKNIQTSFIQTDPAHTTGKVLVEIKENHEVEYEIVKPVAWDFIEWNEKLFPLVEKAKYFVFGSLVTRNKESRNTLFTCIEIAQTKVLDINLRPPHFDKKILKELFEKADILKLNVAELHQISAWYKDYKNDEEKIKMIKEKFGIKTVVVTKGAAGAILYINDLFYYHPGYHVSVVDTVGSGDSFLAAIISKLLDEASAEETLDFANALGAFVSSQAGGCPEESFVYPHNLKINLNR